MSSLEVLVGLWDWRSWVVLRRNALVHFRNWKTAIVPPATTMIGGLFQYLREAKPGHFQPMNSNWGLVEPLQERIKGKKQRRQMLAARAQERFLAWMGGHGLRAVS